MLKKLSASFNLKYITSDVHKILKLIEMYKEIKRNIF